MKLTKRLLALFLAAVMLFSASPMAYAVQMEDEEEEVVVVDETEPEETAEEPAEEAVPEEPEEAEEPAEEPEAAEEPEEAVEETEEELSVLPYGLKGMPEGFKLSKRDLKLKQKLTDANAAGVIAGLTEGVDYVPNQVYFLAKNRAYAEDVAAAFNAELVRFKFGIGVLELSALTVEEAVALASDPMVALPPVNANYRRTMEPVHPNVTDRQDTDAMGVQAPVSESWDSIIPYLSNPDPMLMAPYAMYMGEYSYQWFHDVVNTYEAWGVTIGSPEIKVAVIDTGVDSHTGEFDGRLTQVDVGFGLDPEIYEESAHGTFVASCIAAELGNGKGGAGVAPGVSIVGYRIEDYDGYLDGAAIVAAVMSAMGYDAEGNYLPENAVDIVNMSYGGPIYDPLEEEVYQMAHDAGISMIAAAGNSNSNDLAYPACYPCTISVAATNRANLRSAFSTYGPNVDVAAPGTNIPSIIQYGNIEIMSGTSFACPITAGVAALYMSKMGHVDPETMRSVLRASVTKVSDKTIGTGIVDAAKMFSSDKTAPKIYVLNETYDVIPGTSVNVTVDGGFAIVCEGSNDAMVLYTLDGKNPAVKNGEVICGEVYDNTEEEFHVIKFTDLAPGKYTLKAASISGLGIMSKVSTVKLTISESNHPQFVNVVAPAKMASGTSVTLEAQVMPANAVQGITWTLKEAPEGVTLSDKGVLTAAADVSATVTVFAASTADPSVIRETVIEIAPAAPIASVALVDKDEAPVVSVTMHCYSDPDVKETFAVHAALTDTDGNSREDVTVVYASSNPKVATVNAAGEITAVSKGTATITAKALDGSNKTASSKVIVVPGVESVTLSGQNVVAPGASVVYKAAVNPAKGTGAVVTMGIQSAPESVTFENGKLTVGADTPVDTSFLVWAEANDGNNVVQDVIMVTVAPKATKVDVVFCEEAFESILSSNSENALAEYKMSKGSVSSVTLFTTDGLGYGNVAFLQANVTAGKDAGEWTINNDKVAELVQTEEGCAVIGKAAGTAKVTYTLNDGSKLKKSVTVKVVVPASSVTAVPKDRPIQDDLNFLYFGKSAKNIAVLGDAFGKPTKSKITWDFAVLEVTGYDEYGNPEMIDHTEEYKAKKLVTISSSGTVKLSKKLEDLWWSMPGNLYVDVYAHVVYGPFEMFSVTTEYICSIVPKALELSTTNVVLHPQDQEGAFFDYAEVPVRLRGGAYQYYTCKSSDPKIASATMEYDSSTRSYYVQIVACGLKYGTCKITVSSADSSKLTKTITVKVVK